MISLAEQPFTITYDGPGVSGSIDLRALADSIRGASDLYRDSYGALFPQADDVEVRLVRAEPGSVVLHVILHTLDDSTAVRLFASDTASAIANFIEMFGAIAAAVAFLRRRRDSGEIVRTERIDDTTLRFFYRDGTYEDVSYVARVLAERPSFRKALRQIGSVFGPADVETIELGHPVPGDPLTLTRDDLEAFDDALYPEELMSEDRNTTVVTLRTVALDDRMWRVSHDGRTHFVRMADEMFRSRIDARTERFAKGDQLRVSMQHQVWQVNSGAKRDEWTIVEVLDRLDPPAPQDELGF